jgi:hypothetical protein
MARQPFRSLESVPSAAALVGPFALVQRRTVEQGRMFACSVHARRDMAMVHTQRDDEQVGGMSGL